MYYHYDWFCPVTHLTIVFQILILCVVASSYNEHYRLHTHNNKHRHHTVLQYSWYSRYISNAHVRTPDIILTESRVKSVRQLIQLLI